MQSSSSPYQDQVKRTLDIALKICAKPTEQMSMGTYHLFLLILSQCIQTLHSNVSKTQKRGDTDLILITGLVEIF